MFQAPGKIERIEACFKGAAFAPHRHDTYAIALTLAGVQSFDYRGTTRHSQAGGLVVLHPDELHDGRAGDERPFRYRAVYIAPALLQEIIGGAPLPYVDGGVSTDTRLCSPVRALLEDLAHPLGELEQQYLIYELAAALQVVAGKAPSPGAVNRQAAILARDYIEAHIDRSFSLGELERATGCNRWQLCRDFRKFFGTSPHRYLIARRLDLGRRLMFAGRTTAEAAQACGFADQSHFGRTFKKAFGLTPNRWLHAVVQNHQRLTVSLRRH